MDHRTLAQAFYLVLLALLHIFDRTPLIEFNSVTIPCLIIAGINAKNLWDEHWEHWEHMPPLEERPEYPYQNIRVKNYFWGDGDKTLLYFALDMV